MALDPQAQEVINLVIKSGRPAYNTLSPKEARQLFRETRPASTPTPAEIGSVRDINAEGYMLTRDGMRWFTNHYLKSPAEAKDWRVSPLRAASLAKLPPALVITAGFDPLRDEGAAYARRLTEAGVQVDYVNYGGMIHGFMPMGRLIATGNRAPTHVAASRRQARR